MKSSPIAASLLVALCMSVPAAAHAQEPESAPAPAPAPAPDPAPPPREYAMPRAEAPRGEQIVVRDPQTDAGTAVRREAATVDQGSRRRPVERDRSAPPPAAASAGAETQGAERRGAVRRLPDSAPGGGRASGDRAVPRASVPPRDRQRERVYIYPDYWSWGRFYDPYYYGGFHLGYLAYSPWGWMPAFYGYPHPSQGYPGRYDIGSVKIKVKPRDAEVHVDGYFAGHVDDFDGVWQALKLDTGGHRIEIRKPGYETLQFDVHVQPDRTITYRGEMRPLNP